MVKWIGLTVLLLTACAVDRLGAGPEDCEPDDEFDGDECVFPGSPGPTGFPDVNNGNDDTSHGEGICIPRQEGACDAFTPRHRETGFTCCSDDPAAVGGALPAFDGRAGGGTAMPYFAGANNAIGTSGLCVDTDSTMGGLSDPGAEGCPVPCNPTWSAQDVEAVCGAEAVCCQTRQLQAADCVTDGGVSRPVTGADVFDGLTDWSPGRHATHQDPSGVGCTMLAGDITSPEFNDCVEQLSVADQRGFCVAAQSCPSLAEPC